MIIILSETHYASYILWVVMRTVIFYLRAKMSFQVSKRTLASIPVVGSSSIISFGLPVKLNAKESLRLIPPEKVFTLPSLFFSRLTFLNCDRISLYSIFRSFNLWNISMCCPAVNSYQRISNWGQTPITLRILAMSLYTLVPSIKASPLDLARAPIKMFIIVDFPAPF
jgi:hypothetical protein